MGIFSGRRKPGVLDGLKMFTIPADVYARAVAARNDAEAEVRRLGRLLEERQKGAALLARAIAWNYRTDGAAVCPLCQEARGQCGYHLRLNFLEEHVIRPAELKVRDLEANVAELQRELAKAKKGIFTVTGAEANVTVNKGCSPVYD